MENASKALIIAGAILLSILIIALGIYIYNQAKAAVNTDTLTSTEISTFNAQFNQYEGKCLGSSVKSLIDALISNASTNSGAVEKVPDVYYDNEAKAQSGSEQKISDTYTSGLSSLRNSISNSHNYYVYFTYDNDTGYISYIDVFYTEQTSWAGHGTTTSTE